MTYDKTEHSVDEWIDTVIFSFQERVRKDGIEVVLHKEDNLPRISFDDVALSQVLLNLLDNARHYASDQPRIEVVVTIGRDGGVRIAILDSGPGIPKKYQKKIFKKFYRVETTREKNLSGVGLGLAMSQDIMHAHGGKISLHSIVGQGSTFTIILPG